MEIGYGDKVNYYEMLVGTDYNILTINHIIDILNTRIYQHLNIDYLRIIFAELEKCKDTVEWYKEYGEMDDKVSVVIEARDTKEDIKYTLGYEGNYRLALLEDEVYRDFYEDYVKRVNIYINNLYVYSNVYGDDPMLEFQTYLLYIHINVAWYLGDDEAVRFVKEFTRYTMILLKQQGYTDAYLDVYMDIYRNYKNSPTVEEGRKLRNPKIEIKI